MRLPVREIVGHLSWVNDGTVWATWRVAPVSTPYLGVKGFRELHAKTRAVLMELGGESMLLGLCEPIEAVSVVEKMIDGVDLDAHPGWAEMASAAFDQLAGLALWRRAYFIAIRLPHFHTQARSALDAGVSSLWSLLGVPAPKVPGEEVAARVRQAAEIGEALSRLNVRPASVAELRWIYARAARKALDEPGVDPEWSPAERSHLAQLLPLGDAALKEGGYRADRGRRRHRRYLRVEVPDVGVAYQTFSVVSALPRKWSFPGGTGEWFAQADELVFPVDWCARVRRVSNADAANKARRQHRQLINQVDEYQGEVSGAPASLAEAIHDVDEERSALAGNPADPELQTTIIFGLWAPNLDLLESRANQLRSLFANQEYQLHRPTGEQLALYKAMLPGAPAPRVCGDYTQFLLPEGLAGGAPFTGSEVGDPTGALFGYQLDGHSCRPVLLSPVPVGENSGSRSMAFIGQPGSGKSHAIKLNIRWLTDIGGQVVVLDRTKLAEYKRLAPAIRGTTQVIDLAADTDASLDPLRVFTGADRSTYTNGFLSVLLGTGPLERDGTVLAEAVDAVLTDPASTLNDVVDVLGRRGDEIGDELAGKLRRFERTPLGGVVFADRPPIRLDADYIVFAAQGLHLPTREQVMNEHLARRMLPEQVLSQALLYAVAAITKSVTFATLDRFAVGVFDEVWAITTNPEGNQLIKEQLRDGRKHASAIWVGGQDAEDVNDPVLRSLIPIRLVYRVEHRVAAAESLRFLDLDATDELLKALTAGGEDGGLGIGQCLLRDAYGRIGRIQIVDAHNPELARAMETDPAKLRRVYHEDLDDETVAVPDPVELSAAHGTSPGNLAVAGGGPGRWVRPSRRAT